MSYLKKIEDANKLRVNFPGGIVLGANVRTPCGPRRIEMVRPGDLIVTRDEGLQPVRMIWKREVSLADIAVNPALAPVRFKPRAVGPMMPQKDVCVAADHRILVPGYRLLGEEKTSCCLLSALEFAEASDAAYVDRSAEVVTYFTLIFDTHQVFSADGLFSESFLPTAKNLAALDETLRDNVVRCFPQLKRQPDAYPAGKYKFVTGVEYLPEHV
ncbi:MAG: Hint domain-containing protein [Marinosulfonomonas sp.]|nr:Hint domain-containing protein [Marinosulfonomonas sp.]